MLKNFRSKYFFIACVIFTLYAILQALLLSSSPFCMSECELKEDEINSGKLNLPQDAYSLLNYIKKNHLIPPPRNTKTDWTEWTGEGYWLQIDRTMALQVSKLVLHLLKGKTNGTFIECGANDGEFLSNTRLLEQEYGWSGLLIETDPRPLGRLVKRKRNAWIASACLSTEYYPIELKLQRVNGKEGLTRVVTEGESTKLNNEESTEFTAQCFALYSLVLASGLNEVDYFSFDIEGAELKVLKNVPWDKLKIKVLSIEVSSEMVDEMKTYMTTEAGYKYVTFILNTYTHDQIYVHSSLNDQ